MARMRYNLPGYSERWELPEYKAMRRGATEDAFWDEDELVTPYKVGKKKKKTRAGCPGNNMNNHVYIWVPYNSVVISNYTFYYENFEIKVCCGCLKRAKRQSFRRQR